MLFSTLAIFLSAALYTNAATTDQVCVTSCGDWSAVLGHCRSVFGQLPGQQNYTYANDFVQCLCQGQEDNTAIGNDALTAALGTCQSCTTTPARVRQDLSTLLTLCAIQAQNGSAGDAEIFTPIGYTDSASDANAGAKTAESGASSQIGQMGMLQVGVLVLGVVGGLGVWSL